MYIDKLDGMVNKYNNACRSTIKMKLVDVNSNTNFDFDKENNEEDPKFEVGNHVRISKYNKNLQFYNFTKRLQSKLVWGSFYD